MPVCPYCGNAVGDDYEFCPRCSRKLPRLGPTPLPTPTPIAGPSPQPSSSGKKVGLTLGIIAIVLIVIIIGAAVLSSGPGGGSIPGFPRPQIMVAITFPTQVRFSEVFDLRIVVRNAGGAAANDVHIYLRVNPSGFFELLDSSHAVGQLAPFGIRWTVGNLGSNVQAQIANRFRAPSQQQVGIGMGFEFTFTYDYEGIGETFGDRWILTVGQTGIVAYRTIR